MVGGCLVTIRTLRLFCRLVGNSCAFWVVCRRGARKRAKLELNPDSVMFPSSEDDLTPPSSPLGLRDFPDVSISGCRCDSWFCPSCRVSKALRLRGWLESCASSLFPNPRLLTCTVDPKQFSSPRSAYDFVRGRRFISRLLGLLGVKNYVVVFEVQKSGFPHWHILFNWDCGNEKIDYSRIHRLWKKWGIGTQIVVSSHKKGFSNPVHAIRYITKYLLKGCNWPSWVLDMPRLRVFSTSRAVGAFNVRPSSVPVSCVCRRNVERCRRDTNIRERLERCNSSCSVFRGGSFLYKLDVPWVLVRDCCECVFVEGVGWRWLLVDWDGLAQVCRDCGCNSF